MDRLIRGVVRAVAETFALPGPIVEIGAYQVPGQEAIADLRGFFPDREYVGVDARSGPGVDLVADVEKYPQFVPLCQSLKVKQRTQGADGTEVIVADMTVSFQLVRETFTTQVMLDRANLRILVEYLKGPFSSLENRWAFEPRGESACDVGFFIAYEFRSRMLAALMGAMFDAAFQRFAAAFEKRADAIYGAPRGGA